MRWNKNIHWPTVVGVYLQIQVMMEELVNQPQLQPFKNMQEEEK